MRWSGFFDPWPTSVRNLTNIGSARNPARQRNTAIAVLGRLGERTATPQILSLLERLLRAATGEQALLIAEVLGAISPAGGERLRDLVMERVLEQKKDPSPDRARRVPWAPVPATPKDAQAASHFPGCVPLQAWRSLDPASASAWISRAALLLAQAAPAKKSHLMYTREEREEDSESLRVGGARFAAMLEILGACVEQHPVLIEGLAPLFTAGCDPEVTLLVHRLLKREPNLGTSLAVPGSQLARVRTPEMIPAKSPLQRTSEGARTMILSRLLELTASESWEIRRQAINELAGTPDLAVEGVVPSLLANLTHHADLQTRVLSTAALVKRKFADPSPAFIEELLRIVTTEMNWPAGTLMLLEKTDDPGVFDQLVNRLIDLLETTSAPLGPPAGRPRTEWSPSDLAMYARLPMHFPQPGNPPDLFESHELTSVDRHSLVANLLHCLQKMAARLQGVDGLQRLLQHRLPAARFAGLTIMAELMQQRDTDARLIEAVSSLESDQNETIRSRASAIIERYRAPKSATHGGSSQYSNGPQVLGGLKENPTASPDLQIVADLESPGRWNAGLISLTYLPHAERVHPRYLPALCVLAFGPRAVAPYTMDSPADSLESLIGNIVQAWPQAPASNDTLQAALAALQSPRPELRQRAVGVLSCLPAESVNGWIDPIVASIASSNACERTAALQALRRFGRYGWDAVGRRILALLADSDLSVRCAAVELVLDRNTLPGKDGMLETADDPETSAKVIAALCAFLDDPGTSFAIRLQSLTSEQPLFPGSAKSAINAIGSFAAAAYPAAAFTLLNLLFDEDPEIQFAAAKALCDLGPEPRTRAVESLLAIIEPAVIRS